MLEKFLDKTRFSSTGDFAGNFHIHVPDNFNFAYDVVDEWARTNPNKNALYWTNDRGKERIFTFQDIKDYSDRTAAYLQSLGVGKGDMVMLMLKRRYEFWFAILALHKIGAVAIPATHLLSVHDIVYRANAASIKAIICTEDDELRRTIDIALQESPTVKVKITLHDAPESWLDFHKGIENAGSFIRPAQVNANEDIFLLYFTSGTTGEPKMVIHDFTYPLGHIVTASYWHNIHEDSLHLTVADTGWAKAVWGKLYGQWIAGACVFVYDHERFNPGIFLHLAEKYRITSFCAPPTVYRYLIRENLGRYDLSSLKYCTTAGEALNPSVYEAFLKATGIRIMEAYGQTETTVTVVTFPWMNPKPGSMGVPNPAYDIRLVDEKGNPVGTGQQGEIVIHTQRGKPLGLFMGYYRDSVLTQSVYHENVYHTGDVATMDEDGYLWFVGRLDDVIKSSGYRIGPFEVESAVMTHPAVVECAVTGVPDDKRGQVIKATVVVSSKHSGLRGLALAHDIKAHVKKIAASYKCPRIIEFVEHLPKTISGKIRRREIRDTPKKE
ncbi:AMP-binding protein [Parasphaerochaeta coccoides]|uniref:Butyrate--CoA ligase n=1 Tax=Parasphaerochaeta coccoides (strain ATCC BAA-1237 / DSM 17374 / SPN1) TaxID=760011 RepID=F4GJM2_PARC1|nr:AMP-binding protein [Parasphaerochaeta coccoides]AEC02769.1 Butyrate--CoA ligase [Parasphaerochaeta coccoides DSM 17374]